MLHTRTIIEGSPVFTLMSVEDEAIARADEDNLIGNDSGYEYLIPPEEAAGIRAIWDAPTPEPEFGTTPPRLVGSALNVLVQDGDIPSIDGAFNVIGVFYEDTGLYTLYFLSAQPDVNYFALASGVTLREVDKQTDYLTVEALDANGSRFDPSCFGVHLYRI